MSLFLCCFFAFSSLPKAKSKEVKGGISIFHTLALAVMTLPRSTQIERHLQMNFIFLPCTALTSWKNTFVALSKGLVHNWFVTFLLPRFTAEFGPLWASHLTPRPPAPLQGVPLSAPVKVSDFNVFLFLYFYSSSSANTANHRSAKKRESTGVAVRSRPGSSAGVARLEESHQARRALLPLLLLLCHHPTEIYRSFVAHGASPLSPASHFNLGFTQTPPRPCERRGGGGGALGYRSHMEKMGHGPCWGHQILPLMMMIPVVAKGSCAATGFWLYQLLRG